MKESSDCALQMMNVPECVEVIEDLAEITSDYARRLPHLWEELRDSLDYALVLDAPDLLTESAVLAHRLRGSAGVFGFVRVGEIAGAIEKLLSAQASPDTDKSTCNWQVVVLLSEGAILIESTN